MTLSINSTIVSGGVIEAPHPETGEPTLFTGIELLADVSTPVTKVYGDSEIELPGIISNTEGRVVAFQARLLIEGDHSEALLVGDVISLQGHFTGDADAPLTVAELEARHTAKETVDA